MVLSKKDYIQFAFILKNSQNKEEIINKLMTYFKNDNPLFNEEKFLKALS